jgi:hypothetical protein
MRTAAISLAALVASGALLAACQREPRSASYFEANPNERADVVTDCKSGIRRGDECKNAQFAQEKAANRRSMEDYRSGF